LLVWPFVFIGYAHAASGSEPKQSLCPLDMEREGPRAM
jgi:hypothetical protein